MSDLERLSSPQHEALERLLTNEVVTPTEVTSLGLQATQIIRQSGVKSDINGVDAIVSEYYAPVEVGDTQYYARVGRLKTGDKLGNLSLVLFDENPDLAVDTPNIFAMRFEQVDGRLRLFVDSHIDEMIDDPRYVSLVQGIFKDITRQIRKDATKRQQEFESRKRAVIEFMAEHWQKIAGAGAGILCVLGVGFCVSQTGVPTPGGDDKPPFDERGYELSGGDALEIGESGTPAFSSELLEETNFDSDEIPNMSEDPDDQYSNTDDASLTLTDGLRQVHIYSSEDDRDCQTVPVGDVPEDTQLIHWSDFTHPETGELRIDELEVTFEENEVEVCWTGEELDDYDNPRVVFELHPPEGTADSTAQIPSNP